MNSCCCEKYVPGGNSGSALAACLAENIGRRFESPGSGRMRGMVDSTGLPVGKGSALGTGMTADRAVGGEVVLNSNTATVGCSAGSLDTIGPSDPCLVLVCSAWRCSVDLCSGAAPHSENGQNAQTSVADTLAEAGKLQCVVDLRTRYSTCSTRRTGSDSTWCVWMVGPDAA